MSASSQQPAFPAATAPRALAGVTTTGRLHYANLRARSLLTAKMRLLWVIVGFVFFTLTAFVRIGQLGLSTQAPEHGAAADALVPPRAEITDRNGVPLARAFPSYSLWFNPKALGAKGLPLVKTPEEVARALVQIFPAEDYDDLLDKLKTGKPTYLRRRVLPEEANKVFALGEPALDVFPFLRRNDARQQIERENFLRSLRVAVDIERDALPQKICVHSLPLGVEFRARHLLE